MGGAGSNLKNALEEEYNRLRKKDYLSLGELVEFHIPNLIQLEMGHLGVLFVMDNTKSGRYELDKLLTFSEVAMERAKLYRAHEFQVVRAPRVSWGFGRSVGASTYARVCLGLRAERVGQACAAFVLGLRAERGQCVPHGNRALSETLPPPATKQQTPVHHPLQLEEWVGGKKKGRTEMERCS
ncbi:hypothetical protein CYMTET_8179 [Cymbomonas tetramitiformis]|uniref:Uncharacterized protein n=1 Tax=Cymbomonas tetramitiformis TaxID=36881 RepID=A0AAE0GU46_9CHLO|nr:hypothetical protein CYMTET_8179 [Cymbomonas tetramitiformis]